jgi:hypothetical protein
MVDRHVKTKQRSPSIKSVLAGIREAQAKETTPEGKATWQDAIDYWEKRLKRHG